MTSFSSSEEKKNVEEKNLVVSYKNENSKISYKRKPTPKKDDTKLISFKKNEEKPKEKEKQNDNLKETSIEILKEDFRNFIKTHPSIINKKILIKDDKVKIYQVKNAETVVKRRSKKNSVEIVKEEQKVSFKNQNQEKIKIKESKVEPEKKKDIISTADSNIAQKNQDSNKQVTPTFEKVKVGPVKETIQSNQKVEQNEKQQGGRVIDLPDEKPIEQNDQKQQPTYEEVASKNVNSETFEDEQKESHETSENQKEEINEHGSKKVAFVVKKLHDESFEIVKEEHPVLQKEQYHYKFKKRQEKQTEKEEKEIEDRKFLSRPFEEETKEVSPVHEPHKVIVIQKGRIHPFSKQHMPESFGDQNNGQSLESKNESPVDNENKLDVQTNEDHYLQNTGMVLSSEKLQNIKITGSLTKDNLSIKPVSLIFEKVKLAFVLEESTKNDQVEQQKQQDSEEVKEFPREKESHKTIENQQKESHETSENQQKEVNEHGIKKVAFVVKKLHDENFEIVKEELHVSHKHQHHYKFKKKQKKEKETSEKIVGYNFIPDSNISQTIDQDSEKPITPTFEKVKVAPVEETIQSDQKVEQNEKQEMEGVIDLPEEKPIEQSDQKVQPTYEEIASKNVENDISEDEQKESHKTSEKKRDSNKTFVNQKEESNDKEPKIVEKKFDEKPKEVTEKPKEKPKKEKKNLINVLDEETKERSPMTDFRKERVKHKGRRPSTNHLVSQSSEDQNNNQSFKSENKFYGNVGNLLDVPTSEDYSLPKRMPSDENFLKRSEIDDSKVKVAPVEEKIQSDQKVEQNEKQQGGRVIDLPEEKPIQQSDQKVQPTYEEIASKNVENEISEDEQKESHITSEKKRDSNKTSGNQQKESKKVGSVKIEVVKEEDKEENQQKIDDKEDIEETKEASQLIDFRKERVKHKMRRHSISNFVVPETSERDTNKKIEQSPSNIAQQKHKKAKLSPTNENTNQQILESNVKGEDETNEKREPTESDSNKDVKVIEDKNRPTYEEIVMKNIENESDDKNKTKNINQDIVELKEKKLPEISVDNQHKPTYEEIVMENLPQKSTDNFQKITESDKNNDFSEPKINQDLVRPYTPTFEKVIVEKKDVDIFELPEKKLSEITKDKETTENLPDQSESNKDENLVRPFTPSFEKVTVVPSKRSPSFGSKDTKSN